MAGCGAPHQQRITQSIACDHSTLRRRLSPEPAAPCMHAARELFSAMAKLVPCGWLPPRHDCVP